MSTKNQFSPTLIRQAVQVPLEYFFGTYAPDEFRFIDPSSPDAAESQIIITTLNNWNQTTYQKKPRILIDRGSFQVRSVGLADNQSSQNSLIDNGGVLKKDSMVFVSGTLSILVEARQEGTCEVMTDMVSTFLAWTSSHIADSFGFKQFGLPMQVSECRPSEEETDIFQTQISIPWLMEDQWSVEEDALRLRDFFLDLKTKNGHSG